jgi:predicted amidohydrolase YtcJ
VVLSDDILSIPAERIRDAKVLTTVLGGRAVFGRLE